MPTKRELEHLLQNAGYSRSQAQSLLADGYSAIGEPDGGALDSDVLAALRDGARAFAAACRGDS